MMGHVVVGIVEGWGAWMLAGWLFGGGHWWALLAVGAWEIWRWPVLAFITGVRGEHLFSSHEAELFERLHAPGIARLVGVTTFGALRTTLAQAVDGWWWLVKLPLAITLCALGVMAVGGVLMLASYGLGASVRRMRRNDARER